MPQPTSGQSNRFYTAEFFAECRQRLAAGGVLAFRLDMPENVVTPLLGAPRGQHRRGRSSPCFHSWRSCRARARWSSPRREPLPGNADVLIDRWQSRGLATRLVTPAYLRYLYENDRRDDPRTGCERPRAAPNSDARPICYQFAAVNWLAKFFPELAGRRPGSSVRRAAP